MKETGHREGRGMRSDTTGGMGTQGRARSVRSGLPVKVALEGDRRADLQGEVVSFDRFWMRVKLGASKATAREGSNVGLELAALPGEPPIQVNGIIWRAPGDGLITVLLSLSSPEFSRLKALASASADSRSAPPPASERETRRPLAPRRARRASPAEEAAILMDRGDHEGAARLYAEAVREAPGKIGRASCR